MNLLGNAIKFTSRGEVVLRVAADLEGREATLRFSVSDTGIGIEPEKQDLIFDAFSQADASTTRMFGGTGLGLTICTRIVQLMGGRIWVESAAGKGSTFHFTTQCAVPDQAVASAAHSPMAGVRVLVVDDNSTNLGILKAMLAFSNMRPALAGSGAAALAMLTQAHAGDPFRVMLVDRHMPYMDGFELVERIQRDLHLTLPAVMMLTSSDYQAASKRCREIGVSASLIKPVAEGDLLAALKAVFEPEAAPPADAEVENGSRRHSWSLKILLAEDNVINQKLATRLLEKLGHRVVLAGNGREALDALEAACFELVLMDVQMPEMDGFTATAAIRAKEEATGTHIPIVALTAHAMTGDRERCLKAGMDDYLVKPIDPVLLREAIERATAAVTSCR
jgi:CheY-like chemotaxis protein